VPVVDTTGAGDAFAAAFVVTWLNQHNLAAAAQEGNRVAAGVVQVAGTRLTAAPPEPSPLPKPAVRWPARRAIPSSCWRPPSRATVAMRWPCRPPSCRSRTPWRLTQWQMGVVYTTDVIGMALPRSRHLSIQSLRGRMEVVNKPCTRC
jgi:hypothetical protein